MSADNPSYPNWDAAAVERDLYKADWSHEFATLVDNQAMILDAFQNVTEWLNTEDANSTDSEPTNLGSKLFGIYMLALAKAVGFSSVDDMTLAAPELVDLYREIMFSVLTQGYLIANDEKNIIASPSLLIYIGALPEEYGDEH